MHSPQCMLYENVQPTTQRLERLRATSSDASIEYGIQNLPNALSTVKELNRRVLSTMSIVGLCYFAVSGGPIGSEYVISAGGPLAGFIGLVVFPLVWSVPIAIVTAKLSTAFPEDGGYTVWVLNAFGPFWGFQTGYWAWISGVVDNAIYPGVAVATFTSAYGSIGSPTVDYLVKAVIAVALTLPNLFGVRCVGNGMMVLSTFVLIPFFILSIWGLVRTHDWSVFGEFRRSNIEVDDQDNVISMTGNIAINWSRLIQTLFWNFNGMVGVSVFGGEVRNPERTYPRALVISVLLTTITYLLPLAGATGFNSPHWSSWIEGSFSGIAKAIGDAFLSNWIILATFVSNAGMYISELFIDSFQILGMAECELAPSLLKKRNKQFDTPHYAVLASLVIILILIKFEFEDILSMTNALSGIYQLLILAAFIRLQTSHPGIQSPEYPRESVLKLALMLIFPACILVYIIVDVLMKLEPAIFVVVTVVIGFLYARMKNFTRDQFDHLRVSE